MRLHHAVNGLADARFAEIPVVARSMCLSPFDAAIHDAVGKAHGRSAFDLYETPCPIPSADHLFPAGACAAIARCIRKKPIDRFPAWLIVGKNDDLHTDLRPWV